ncbi:MAG TPA: DUF4215 domain-containing protein [Nannocystis sp.]
MTRSTSMGDVDADANTSSISDTAGDASGGASMGEDAASTTDTSTGAGLTTGEPGPLCGDGVKEGEEECDDANQSEGDGCLSNCTREWFVFVTSEPFTQGDITGSVGADYQCRHRAAKMFLPNGERYMAWISTSEVQPVDRMYHARGPYKLVNGLRVAAGWDALIAGPLENPIMVSELGETVDALVFTGTQPSGERVLDSTHCDDWSDSDGTNFGWYGVSSEVGVAWTLAIEEFCGGNAAIYCFEQP